LHLQSHSIWPCLLRPALSRTTRRPNRCPIRFLKQRAAVTCLRKQPQERVCPETRWQPAITTIVLFWHVQEQTQRARFAREFVGALFWTVRAPKRCPVRSMNLPITTSSRCCAVGAAAPPAI